MTADTSQSLRSVFETVADKADEVVAFPDELKVLVLRNITVEGFETLLQFHLLEQRLRARVVFGGYGQMSQDVLNPDGPAAQHQPDIIVLCLSLRELDPGFGLPGWSSAGVKAELESLLSLLAARTRATIVAHTFLPPIHAETGLAVDQHGGDIGSQVDDLNRFIVDWVRRHAPRIVLADWVRTVLRLGSAQALDGRAEYLWRAPLRRPMLDEHAKLVARVGLVLKGRVRKVLVLDCDNTLWGGVVGEDGVGGIALDAAEYPGRAFVDFQASVLHLAERGVLIALCSKNEEADVFEVLDGHQSCLIKRRHLAAWRINWTDKATNIRDLAEELNLGLDSFVFVDDNPVECELVAGMLPQVKVLQVPKRLHELPDLLFREACFDTLSITDEDRQRAGLYQGEAQRRSERAQFTDLDAYLAALGIVATIRRDEPNDVARMAQLTQKTNQFNVTTRRYGEADVTAMVRSPDWAVYSLSVEDRFGQLGLVGVLFVEFEGSTGRIDTFLMSCRALGRRLEDAMIASCVDELTRERGIERWVAEYVPTRKNAQVATLWSRLGFEIMTEHEGARRYVRAAGATLPVDVAHVQIRRNQP